MSRSLPPRPGQPSSSRRCAPAAAAPRICGALLLLAAVLLAAPAAARPIVDLDLVADQELTRNAEAAVDLTVRLATSLTESAPLAGAKVRLELVTAEGARTPLAEGLTRADGRLAAPISVPDVAPGDYTLEVHVESAHGGTEASLTVEVTDATVLVLRTDRGVYRPGQTVRFSVIALNDSTGRPIAGARADLAVKGPRGTKVWSGQLETDATGMVAGELPLADDLVLGNYALTARVGDTTATETVDVRRPVVPAFAVDATIEPAEGDAETARVVVTARYLYGEPVAGKAHVKVTGGREVVEESGPTDAAGRFVVTVPLGGEGGVVTARAEVTDGAGRTEVAVAASETPGGPLEVVLVPEAEVPLAGRPLRVSAFAVEADGRLAPARLRLELNGKTLARSDAADGVLSVTIPVPAPRLQKQEDDGQAWWAYADILAIQEDAVHLDTGTVFEARADRIGPCTGLEKDGGEARLFLRAQGGAWHLDRAIVTSSLDRLARADATPAMRRCVARALRGVVPERGVVWGEASINVNARWVPDWEDPKELRLRVVASTGDKRKAETTLELQPVAEPEALMVRVAHPVAPPGEAVEVAVEGAEPGRTYVATLLVGDVPVATAPCVGGRALLSPPTGAHGLATARITALPWGDEDVDALHGAAAVYLAPRALSVSIETEGRVRPGADTPVRVLVTDEDGAPVPGVGVAASVVDERILRLSAEVPSLADLFRDRGVAGAEVAGVAFASLLQAPASVERDLLQAAILWQIGATARGAVTVVPSVERLAEASERIRLAREALTPALAGLSVAVVRRGADGAWELAVPLTEVLAGAGWEAQDLRTPFDEPVDASWLGALDGPLPVEGIAEAVTLLRLDDLDGALIGRDELDGAIGPTPVEASTLGDDESIPPAARVDAWGAPLVVSRPGARCLLELRSAGPDGRLLTDDDLTRPSAGACAQLAMSSHLGRAAYGMAGVGMGAGGSTAYGRISTRGSGTAAPERTLAVRKRFDETVLWEAGVPTDVHGAAVFDVEMADSITGWRVAVDALSADGRAGAGRGHIETFLPLHVDADVPPELTVGDRYTLTAVAANHSGAAVGLVVRAQVEGAARLAGPAEQEVAAADGATVAAMFPIEAHESGDATVRLTLVGPEGPVDSVEHTLRVEPQGHLEQALVTGEVRDGEGVLAMTVPGPADRASIRSRLRLYRGAADQAMDGLDDMLREPHGCFEQTSSTTYPNLLILRLLEGSPGAGAIRDRARTLVLKGYQRLLTFEVAGGGFSWFGSAPANRVLTAYGLVEFADMAKVAPVDAALIARTRDWLVGLQGEDGSWEPDASWLHDWSAVQGAVSTTAWITWALAEAGQGGEAVDKGLAFLRAHPKELGERAYLLALWAAAERAAGQRPEEPLGSLATLAQRDDEGLRWAAGSETLLYGGGRAADVEVTAVALRALVGEPGGATDRDDARRWLWGARSPSYGWGTTQATVQTLRAAALIEEERGAPPTGPAHVLLDGREVGVLDLAAPSLPTLDLTDLGPGEHHVTVRADGGGGLLTDLRASWRRTDAPGPIDQGLEIRLRHDGAPVKVGHTTRMTATVHNPGAERVAMPTIVAPVPPGFRVTVASLKRLEASPAVTRAEDQGSEIHLYMELLTAGATTELTWELEATAPCDVTQRGARAYAYYAPETRGTSPNLRLVATPR